MRNIIKMEVFPYSWNAYEEYGCQGIRIFGLNKNNESVFVLINDFRPYLYLELPYIQNLNWTQAKSKIDAISTKIDEICGKIKPVEKKFELKKKLYYAKKETDSDGKFKDKLYPFLKCFFKCSTDLKQFSYKMRSPITVGGFGKISLKTHESEANPILQFMCMKNIKPAGWFKFLGQKIDNEDDKLTSCKYEYVASWKNFIPVDKNVVSSPLIMGFDIEVNSSNPNVAPQVDLYEDKIFQISCVLCRNGDKEDSYKKYILSLGMNKKGEQIDLIPEKVGEDIEIRMFDTESDLLMGFNEIVNELNPQIVCGYNIFGFDLPYIYKRTKLNAITSMFDQLSFVKGLHSKEVKIEWSSSAFKNQNFTYLDAPGRLWIDMLPIIQRDYKLENYKLKTVSDLFLGSTKDPLTVKGIFKCYRMFTPDSLSVVAKYCVKDSELVVKLFEKLQIWIGLVEMSNTCNTPIFTLFTQGQQIKIFSQVYKKCISDNIVIDKDSFIVNENDHFTGAYVFTPVPGLYDMVVSFDFSSLYPSTIIAYNIDYSTLVLDDTIPDEKCHIFEWEDHFNCTCPDAKIVKTKKVVICKKNRFRFLKEPMGVIPTLLTNLIDARKKAKKEMERLKETVDDIKDEKEREEVERMITVFDKRQLAFKVSCNSVSSNTPIPCIDEDGKFMYLTMEEISDGVWISDDDKNQVSKPKKGLSVWTEKGYTKINYVIRHPIRTPLKRVLTHTGCVDVTEEHSLLDEKANEVRTIDLSVGDKLLHHPLPFPSDTPNKPMFHTIHKETIEKFDLKGNIDYERAFVWGLFFAEGTSGTWGVLENAKSSWIIYNLDKDLLTRAKSIIEKVENMTFMISDLYKNSGSGIAIALNDIYHLKPVNNKESAIVSLCKKYRSLFYDQRGCKRIPSEIFQSDFYTRQSFLMGYYAGDGARFLKKGVVINNRGEIGTAGLCYLVKSLGYIVSVTYVNKEDRSIYRLQCCTSFRYKNTTSIKSILPTTPLPEIKKLQPDIIRNDTKIFFTEEGVVMYRGVRINCERIPRQKLLDAIDRLIDVMKIRKCSILEYYTDSKKIKYKTWCCEKEDLTGIKGVYIENTTYLRLCECDKDELKDNGYNNLNTFQQDEKVEYIYDIETENHHFAAGVGDLIVHNSMYGGMGVKRGYLPFLPGAMCTTARGRQSIEKASKFLVENYGAKLIYGDSVSGDTPILVRYEDQTVDILRIDNIGEVWKPYEEFKSDDTESNRKEKQQTLPFVSSGNYRVMNILEVWTGSEWSKVRRVIRHKTVKKMYRVLTHTGCVDVTEDHSLLDKNLNKIKPSQLNIGSELYHSFPPKEDFLDVEFKDALIEGKVYECSKCNEHKLIFEFYNNYKICKKCVYEQANGASSPNHKIERKTYNKEYISETEYIRNLSRNLNEDLAYIWGMFFAEGSCGSYECKTGTKNSWAINNQDLSVLEKCKSILEKCEPLFGWKILDTMHSSSVYKLVPQGHLQYIVKKWRMMFYDKEGYKKVPYFILNSNDSVKSQFFSGYYEGDGDKHTFNRIKQFKFDIKGKIGAHGLYTLLYSLGYNVAINTKNKKDNIYTLHTCNNFRKSETEVKKIIELPETKDNEYVYDIETESGRFLGGIGKIILKNTDSCYISFPQFSTEKDAKDLDMFCRKVEEETSSLFPRPMKFAYEEAIYWRYLILSKKRYMALKCDVNGKVKDKIEKRGVLLSRRDNSSFSRDFYSKVIMQTFYKDTFENIMSTIVEETKKICNPVLADDKNKINPSSLIPKELSISKSVGDIKDYKLKPLPTDTEICNKCKKENENKEEKDKKFCRECNRINLYQNKVCDKCKKNRAILNVKTPSAIPSLCFSCKEEGMVDVFNKKLIKRLGDLKILDLDADLETVKKIFMDMCEEVVDEDKIDDHKVNNQLEYQIVCEYINRSLPSHMQLAQKMRRRGTYVAAGERIAYVVVESDSSKDKLFEKIEDLDYFKENIRYINIDQPYYIRLMVNPIDEVIKAVYKKEKVYEAIHKQRELHNRVIDQIKELFSPKIKLIE